MAETKQSLLRALTLTDAIALVVGTVIGTGVFLKTAVMTQQLGSPSLVLLAWLAAGLLSLAGALAYAELGAMFPQAGGEYVYLGKAFGETPAFLYGWMQFAVAGAGGIAGISVGFAIFLSALIPLGGAWVERTFHLFGQEVHWQFGLPQVLAVAVIVLLSAINCIGVAIGGRVQSLLTGAKLLGIAVIVTGVFFFSPGASWSHLAMVGGTRQLGGVQAFGAAMMAALWAYNGWYMLPILAGEVQRPQRNVPRGLILGMLAVMATYLLANLAYFYALPLTEVVTANSTAHPDALPVAAKAAQTFLGPTGAAFISIAFVVSTLGALNGAIMGQARIPFAMARDGLFFRRAGEVGAKSRAPVWAIIAQSGWGCVLALTGTFDQISTYVIFALWLFFGVTVSAVFVLRWKMPDVERPYKTLGYPLVPALFILVAAWLVINTIRTDPIESGIGLALVALGLPVYIYFKRKQTRAVAALVPGGVRSDDFAGGTSMTNPAEHSARLRSFAEAYTAAWCSQDATRVASFYAGNGSLSVNDAAPAVGREAIAEVAQEFMTYFPDMQVFLDELRLGDEGAIYHWTLTGTNTGPAGTGRPLRISGYEIWEIGEDGLIAKSRGHFDSEDYRRQLEAGH